MQTGSAQIVVELTGGDIRIRHGEDNALLYVFPKVSEGSWSAMLEAITKTLREREL